MNKQEIYKNIKTTSAILGLFLLVFVLFKITPDYRGSTIVKDFNIKQISSLPGEPIKWIKTVSVSEINKYKRYIEVPEIANNIKVSTLTGQATTLSNIKTNSSLTNADRIKLSESSKKRSNTEASLALARSVKVQKEKSIFDLIKQTFSKLGSMSATVGESSTETEMVLVDVLPVVETPEEIIPTVEEETSSTTEEIILPTEEKSTSTEVIIIEEATTTEEVISTSTLINGQTEEVATTTEEQETPSTGGGSSSGGEEVISTSTQIVIEGEASSIATTTDLVVVEYETPAPTIAEATTDTGKVVSISSVEGEVPITDVLAFTNIPEIYKVGQEDKIKIKWSNNGDQNVTFKAYDLNDNGKLDYVEWTVPHLSTQIFEIIFISKAFQLDANKEIISDIYDTVKTQDDTWAPISDGQYVRVTFENILTNNNDITLYARPAGATPVTIEAYTTDTNQLVATFDITEQGLYKELIPDLQSPTDLFDLKIVGEVEIDYVVDPTVIGFTAHYDMNDTDGTTVVDSSGNNYNGTGTYTPTTGIIDGGLSFNGTTDYVGVNYDIPRAATTISFWVKSLRNDQGIMQISAVGYKYISYTDRAFMISPAGNIIFDVYSSGDVLLYGGYVGDGNWHHVLATWDNSGKSLYVDSVLVDTAVGGMLPVSPMPYITIGEAGVGGVYVPTNTFFKGSIDDFTIYTKVLSQEEINTLYAEGDVINPDNTPPIITVSSPTDGSIYSPFSVDFDVSATDETSLGFIVPDLDSSLVSWWRMDDKSGSTLTDYNGNNDGIAYGASQTTGKFGKGISFNGIDNYISIPHSNAFDVGSNNFTFSTWFYPTSSNVGQAIFASDTDYKFGASYSYPAGNKKLGIWAGNGSSWNLISSESGNGVGTITMEPNNWYHIIYQREGYTFRTYINGVLDLQLTNITGSIVTRDEPFVLGRWGAAGTRLWNSSKLDEFLFFNRALDTDEINALYNGSSIDNTKNLALVSHTYKTYSSDLAGNVTSSSLSNFSFECETITIDGLYTIHTFVCDDTFTPSDNVDAEILVVAGGGGGGKAEPNLWGDGAGGGGAGGLIYNNSQPISPGSYTVVVGSGGLGSTIITSRGGNGENSSFDSLVAVGGGGGGTDNGDVSGVNKGADGGSGGGAASMHDSMVSGGVGTIGQGNNGGNDINSTWSERGGAGGGGAGTAGGDVISDAGSVGGAGLSFSITGSSSFYAGGGGGGAGEYTNSGGAGGSGGILNNPGGNAVANTGSGGGGGGTNGGGVVSTNGGNGSDGIVVIRYLTPDVNAPTGGSITYTDGYNTSPTITYTLGTDDVSGINNSSGKIQRAEATLSNNVCSSFGSFSDLVAEYDGSYSDTSVVDGKCYKYQYLISDNSNNTATYISANVLKVDTTNPSVDIGIDKIITLTYTQISTTSDEISGIALYLWSSDANINFGATTSSSTNISATTEGDHIIRLTVTDVAGNFTYDEYTLTWDSVSPIVSNISPTEGSTISSTNQSINFNISENGDCRLSIENKSYDDMSADIACTSNVLLISCVLPSFSSSGAKDIYIACKDSFDNKDTASTTTHVSYTVRSNNGGGTGTSEITTPDPEVVIPPVVIPEEVIIPEPEIIPPPPVVIEEPEIITPEIENPDITTPNTQEETNSNEGGDSNTSNHNSGGNSAKDTEKEDTSTNIFVEVGIKIVKGITVEAEKILASPIGSVTTKTISTIGVVAGTTATVSTLAFANPITLSEIWFLPTRLFGLILGWLGIRRKSRPWGTVYDSVTKRPIDPAYLSLINQQDGKEVAMAITDIDGRYGFFAPKGKYNIIAKKTNYIFPSLKIKGINFDEVYSNLYFGNEIIIGNDGDIITKDIPMDCQTFDWNEFTKNKQGLNIFIKSKNILWARFSKIIFWFGFTIALVALISAPVPYNYGIFSLYMVLYILNFFGFGSKKSGVLKDTKTNSPLSFAIVKIFREGSDIEMLKKVTDIHGKYYCLIPNGRYYMKVEKKNIDGTYTSVYQSDLFDVERGIINMNIEI